MRDEPVRLSSGDDAFARALRAERADAAALPVRAQKRRVLAAIAAGAVPVTALSAALGIVGDRTRSIVLALVIAAAFGAGALSHAAWTRATPIPATAADAPAVAQRLPVSPLDVSPPVVSPPVVAPEVVRPALPATKRTIAASSQTATAPMDAAPQPTALADELMLFERAQGALESNRPAIAARELRAYLDGYPRGRLRNEAHETLAQALVRAGRFEEALEACDAAAREGVRPPGITLLHIAALAALGRCDEGERVVKASAVTLDADALRRARGRCAH